MEASAAPMPSPAASIPIRPTRIECLIGLPSRGRTPRVPAVVALAEPPMSRNLLRAGPPHACLTQVELRGFVHC